MYSLSGFGNTFWLISNQVDDPTFLLAGFEENATCPDGKKLLVLLNFFKPNRYLAVNCDWLNFQII